MESGHVVQMLFCKMYDKQSVSVVFAGRPSDKLYRSDILLLFLQKPLCYRYATGAERFLNASNQRIVCFRRHIMDGLESVPIYGIKLWLLFLAVDLP